MQTKILSEIIKLSPANSNLIKDLYVSSDIFHSLCVDLYDCQTMIKKLKEEKTINNKLLEEYNGLFDELRGELNSTIYEMIENE